VPDGNNIPEDKHGTRSGYVYYKCRCAECKQANQIYKKAWRASNLEDRRDYDRSYGQAHATQRHARVRKHRAENPDRYRDYSRKYLEANREKYAEWNRRYAKTERGRLIALADRARRRGSPFSAEAKRYIQIIKDDPCVYCGEPSTEIDHIVPMISGGSGDWINIAPSCRSCNAAKKEKSLLAYLMARSA
jgi:hypothetical protein